MITIEKAEEALKSVYLGVIQNHLNNRVDPVLAKIKKTSEDVWGKTILSRCFYRDNYFKFEEELSTLTATIEISDRAIRCSQNSAGAFVNLINDNIENMLNDTTRRLINSFYAEDVKPGWMSEQHVYEPMKVTGLKKLFDTESEYLYNCTRKNNSVLNPIIERIDKFDPIKIQEIIDNNNDEINIIICSPKIKRDYMQYLITHNQDMKNIDLDGGFKGILFNASIPMHTNRNIPDGELYLINTEDFKLHQLCDWEWLEDENGRILRRDTDKSVYRATLVKYANYICKQPNKQIKITIDEK